MGNLIFTENGRTRRRIFERILRVSRDGKVISDDRSDDTFILVTGGGQKDRTVVHQENQGPSHGSPAIQVIFGGGRTDRQIVLKILVYQMLVLWGFTLCATLVRLH